MPRVPTVMNLIAGTQGSGADSTARAATAPATGTSAAAGVTGAASGTERDTTRGRPSDTPAARRLAAAPGITEVADRPSGTHARRKWSCSALSRTPASSRACRRTDT